MEVRADKGLLLADPKILKQTTLGEVLGRYRDTVSPNKRSYETERIVLSAFLLHPICRRRLRSYYNDNQIHPARQIGAQQGTLMTINFLPIETEQPEKVDEFEGLLRKVEAVSEGTAELDRDFATVFASAPPGVTRSIDCAVGLIETELPGWWWSCAYCKVSDDASLCVPGSSRFPHGAYTGANLAADGASKHPEALRLLNHPEWGRVFYRGFHRDRRGGTVPLALLAVFFQAKITLTRFAAGEEAHLSSCPSHHP